MFLETVLPSPAGTSQSVTDLGLRKKVFGAFPQYLGYGVSDGLHRLPCPVTNLYLPNLRFALDLPVGKAGLVFPDGSRFRSRPEQERDMRGDAPRLEFAEELGIPVVGIGRQSLYGVTQSRGMEGIEHLYGHARLGIHPRNPGMRGENDPAFRIGQVASHKGELGFLTLGFAVKPGIGVGAGAVGLVGQTFSPEVLVLGVIRRLRRGRRRVLAKGFGKQLPVGLR